MLVRSFLVLALLVAGCSSSSPAAGPGASVVDGGGGAPSTDSGAPKCGAGLSLSPGDVLTDVGALRGTPIGGTWAYLNVPFAAPPVGDLRWKPPVDLSCWEGIRDATAFGPACPQSDATGTAPVVGDEDCLELNVWTPAAPGDGPLPVLFWIHGGGFTGGSAAEQNTGVRIYDGQLLAEKTHSVVVTTNYRLGVLGFLALPELAAEASDGGTGNYGFLDQLAALRFVKRNIAAFGGDPSRVAIAGESAGGASVCMLVASPLSRGLFAAAVMESGGCKANTLSQAEAFGATVVTAAHCDGAGDVPACLRAVAPDAMVSAVPVEIDVAGATGPYGGVIDQAFLPDAPLTLVRNGAHQHVPMIVGSNSDETSRTVPLPPTATDAQYQAAVKTLLGPIAPAVLAEYPSTDFASPWAAYVAMTSDAKFTCGARRAIVALVGAQAEPVYRYFFTHALDDAPKSRPFGAWHGIDVLYLFEHTNVAGYVPSAGEVGLSDAMGRYWTSLAGTGTPSADGEPAWPPSDAQDSYLELATPRAVGAGVRTKYCDFWDQYAL
ncbi:MAG TPA: carboxylesterase family protein [Polyangiaceae bacterium]|nr:carboxylesterase family protein [Polyangiaceae bacterium]